MIINIPTKKKGNVPNYFAEKLSTLLVDREDWPKLHEKVSRGLLGRLREKHHHIVDSVSAPKEKVATLMMEDEEDGDFRLFDCKISGTEKIQFLVSKDGPKATRTVKISGKIYGTADFRSGVIVNCDPKLSVLAANEGYSSAKQMFDNIRPTLTGRIYHFTNFRYVQSPRKKAAKTKS